MTQGTDEQDKRLVQPAQAIGGALVGTLGAHAGATAAGRLGAKPAALAGRRLGAIVRFAGKHPIQQGQQAARQSAGILGAAQARQTAQVASGVLRHQSHLVSRLGRLATRGGIIGTGIVLGSAVGDYIGDKSARIATGATGKSDEYRHQSILGMVGGGAGAMMGAKLGAMRRMRQVAPLARTAAKLGGTAGGTLAGEAAGNVHDARLDATPNLVGSDRRMMALGKSTGPVWVGGFDGKPSKPTDSQQGFASTFQRSWLPADGGQAASTMRAVDSPTGGSTQAQSFSTGFKNWKSKNSGFFASLGRFSTAGSSFGAGLSSGLGGDLARAAPAEELRKFDGSPASWVGGRHREGMRRIEALGDLPEDGTKRQAWREQRNAIVREFGSTHGEMSQLGPLGVRTKPLTIDAKLQRLAERRGDVPGDVPATSQGTGRGELSAAEHAQRVAAGKASAAKRKQGGGGDADGPKMRISSLYRQGRISHDDPDFDGKGKTQEAAEGGGLYRHVERRPQEPSSIPKEKVAELQRFAGKRTTEMRDQVITSSSKLIPAGTDPKVVRAAYAHAQNLALHDVGLFDLRFRMNAEAKPQQEALKPFIWHARRAMANTLRQERPGEWAPFRAEFGKPFKDGRTYQQDTRGQQAGDLKRQFYRHAQLVKGWPTL